MSSYNVHDLKSHELEYELVIRGITCATDANVDQKRKMLRGALLSEAGGLLIQNILNPLPRATDLQGLEQSITDLVAIVKTLTPITSTTNDIRRINSRMKHLGDRWSRMSAGAEDDTNLRGKWDQLVGLVYCLRSDLMEEASDNSDPEQPRVLNDSHLANSFRCLSMPSTSFYPVHKWQIAFSGDRGSLSLLDFIERVEDLRSSRGVTHAQLFAAASDLLTGSAMVWFRDNRSSVSTWNELITALKMVFLPLDLDSDIRRKLEVMKQSNNENVSVFISRVNNLFGRLSKPVAEDERLTFVRERLLPFFIAHTAAMDFGSLNELASFCRRLERSRILCHEANAFSSPSFSSSSKSFNAASHNAISDPTSSTRNVKCYNCSQAGHLFRNCTKPLAFFCFVCGKRGISSRDCQHSKNEKRRSTETPRASRN